jgi:glycosyltransferase involved in cell wall biosynthesis
MTTSTIPANAAPDPSPTAETESGFVASCGLTVHAVLPPPVTGMTLCTESVVNAVARRVPVRRYNWSNGSPQITRWFRYVKALRALTTPLRLLFGSRPRHGVFYMPCNAGWATVFNFLALSAARLRGYRCVLHHHYYRYVDRFERRIMLLTRVLGPNDLQIVLCPAMERGFRARYGQSLPIAVMPSTIQLLHVDMPSSLNPVQSPPHAGPFCIGHLTNLQLAKGLDLVFEVLRTLRRQGRDVRLILAGPIDTDVERRMIEAAQVEFGERLDYRGPVYGPDKSQFYQDIDAIVYPTRNDAQPLVIMESFSLGRPVLSYGRGCIPGMMPRAEWSIGVGGDFVRPAVDQIERWIDDPAAYAADGRLARQSFDAAIVGARAALESFVHWVCREPDHGFVRRGAEDATTTNPACV